MRLEEASRRKVVEPRLVQRGEQRVNLAHDAGILVGQGILGDECHLGDLGFLAGSLDELDVERRVEQVLNVRSVGLDERAQPDDLLGPKITALDELLDARLLVA